MSTYVAVDKGGSEWIYDSKPYKGDTAWSNGANAGGYVPLPRGAIELLIGKKLTWKDKPVKLSLVKDRLDFMKLSGLWVGSNT